MQQTNSALEDQALVARVHEVINARRAQVQACVDSLTNHPTLRTQPVVNQQYERARGEIEGLGYLSMYLAEMATPSPDQLTTVFLRSLILVLPSLTLDRLQVERSRAGSNLSYRLGTLGAISAVYSLYRRARWPTHPVHQPLRHIPASTTLILVAWRDYLDMWLAPGRGHKGNNARWLLREMLQWLELDRPCAVLTHAETLELRIAAYFISMYERARDASRMLEHKYLPAYKDDFHVLIEALEQFSQLIRLSMTDTPDVADQLGVIMAAWPSVKP